MKDFLEFIAFVVGACLVVFGLITFLTYLPSNDYTRYGDFLCTIEKGWGFGGEKRTCQVILPMIQNQGEK